MILANRSGSQRKSPYLSVKGYGLSPGLFFYVDDRRGIIAEGRLGISGPGPGIPHFTGLWGPFRGGPGFGRFGKRFFRFVNVGPRCLGIIAFGRFGTIRAVPACLAAGQVFRSGNVRFHGALFRRGFFWGVGFFFLLFGMITEVSLNPLILQQILRKM